MFRVGLCSHEVGFAHGNRDDAAVSDDEDPPSLVHADVSSKNIAAATNRTTLFMEKAYDFPKKFCQEDYQYFIPQKRLSYPKKNISIEMLEVDE